MWRLLLWNLILTTLIWNKFILSLTLNEFNEFLIEKIFIPKNIKRIHIDYEA